MKVILYILLLMSNVWVYGSTRALRGSVLGTDWHVPVTFPNRQFYNLARGIDGKLYIILLTPSTALAQPRAIAYEDSLAMTAPKIAAIEQTVSEPTVPALITPTPRRRSVDSIWVYGGTRELRDSVLDTDWHLPVAFKTNLLYDLVTGINGELEFPLARHWSVMLDYTCPWFFYGYKRNCWWIWNHYQNCVELNTLTLETRHYFGHQKPIEKTPHRGWFVGAVGGMGYYDLERHAKGYRGWYWMAGVAVGYVHHLSPHWLMEYSLDLGYLASPWKYYEARWNNADRRYHLIRQYDGKTNWVGPLRAKVSLVWYPKFYRYKNKVR